MGEVSNAISEWEELLGKASSAKLVELIERRIEIAKEWEKVLKEY